MNGFEAPFPRHIQKGRQLRMSQGLAHQVVVKIVGLPLKCIQHMRKLLAAHAPGSSAVPVTEGTAHIANIGDLNINLGVHEAS